MILAAAIVIAAAELLPAAAAPPPPLSESVRAELWESEHAAFLLEQVAFPSFADAFVKGDREALLGFFSNPDALTADTRKTSATCAETVATSKKSHHGVRVLSLRKSTLKQTRGVPLWDGEGILRLSGENAKSAPWETTLTFTFRARVTNAETIRAGGWLESFQPHDTHFATAPAYFFNNVTNASGLDPDRFHDNWHEYAPTVLNTGGIYVEDLDRDGLLDILVTDIRAGLIHYKGEPEGMFKDVTASSGLAAERTLVAAIADLDSDGWPDVITGSMGDGLRIFRNNGGGKFEPAPVVENGAALNALVSKVSVRNIPVALVPADFDGDGLLDLYLARVSQESHDRGTLIDGESGPESAGQLLKNLGGFRFEDVTEKTGAAVPGLSTFAAAWFYHGDDLFPDLFLTHEFGRGVLLENKDGKRFTAKRLGAPGSGFGSMGLAVGDIDGDLKTDLYISSMFSKAGARVLSALPDGAFPGDQLASLRRLASGGQIYLGAEAPAAKELGGTRVGWSWGCTLTDFDNDSAPDLFVTSGFVSRNRRKPDG